MNLRTKICAVFAVLVAGVAMAGEKAAAPRPKATMVTPALGEFVILGWNDLGMHCMNKNFDQLMVLPPFNTMYLQVIQRGNPPRLITTDTISSITSVSVTYQFINNTTSYQKVNFWTYAQSLLGLPSPLPNDMGLKGFGMTGQMPWNAAAAAFVAEGVPLTPFDDGVTAVEQPYQLAQATLRMEGSTAILDQSIFVAPVSTEMHCDSCHGDAADPPSVYRDILAQHDEEEGTTLSLQTPVLCAKCHADPALGAPGIAGRPSLSLAMHGKHADENPNQDCYTCHPGTLTRCLRDVMFTNGKQCKDCHGNIGQVANSISSNGRRPWLDEPRCGDCHDAQHQENPGKLYRHSTGHAGLYCAACHNSPHAILPTVQERDGRQATRVQGYSVSIRNCLVCHTEPPLGTMRDLSGQGHATITSFHIAEHLLGRNPLEPADIPRADFNHDGRLNSGDVSDRVKRGM